jgi:hypothetical protein
MAYLRGAFGPGREERASAVGERLIAGSDRILQVSL